MRRLWSNQLFRNSNPICIFFQARFKIECIMKIADILMLNQSNFKTTLLFLSFQSSLEIIILPLQTLQILLAATLRQMFTNSQPSTATVGLAIIQLLRLVSSILPKSEKSVRVSTAVFEEITLKHCHFANAIYNSPKYFCCRYDQVVFTRSPREKLCRVCARIKFILSVFLSVLFYKIASNKIR